MFGKKKNEQEEKGSVKKSRIASLKWKLGLVLAIVIVIFAAVTFFRLTKGYMDLAKDYANGIARWNTQLDTIASNAARGKEISTEKVQAIEEKEQKAYSALTSKQRRGDEKIAKYARRVHLDFVKYADYMAKTGDTGNTLRKKATAYSRKVNRERKKLRSFF